MKTLTASIKKFKDYLENLNSEKITRTIIFGSASYNDFILGYSDIDIFVSLDIDKPDDMIENIIMLKNECKHLFHIKNVDFTIIQEDELKREKYITLNPFIFEEIKLGNVIYGEKLPDVYTNTELKNDGCYVAASGLRSLRSSLNKIYEARPEMIFRTCDELLFKSTKALLTYLTGQVYSSRGQIVEKIKEIFNKADTSIYDEILNHRYYIKEKGVFQPIDHDRIILKALITFENIWMEVINWKVGI
jgi:predicted nucleotidyltransferase